MEKQDIRAQPIELTIANATDHAILYLLRGRHQTKPHELRALDDQRVRLHAINTIMVNRFFKSKYEQEMVYLATATT